MLDIDDVLGPKLRVGDASMQRKYVPKHLPQLPSRHTWKCTEVLASREDDSKKLRERAVQDGVMAEQALRRLTEASQSKAAERQSLGAEGRAESCWGAVLATIEKLDGSEGTDEGTGDAGFHDELPDDDVLFSSVEATMVAKVKHTPQATFESTMAVNYEGFNWRDGEIGKA